MCNLLILKISGILQNQPLLTVLTSIVYSYKEISHVVVCTQINLQFYGYKALLKFCVVMLLDDLNSSVCISNKYSLYTYVKH